MIKYLPILFKGEMVRAILDGQKSQTRRIWCELVKSLGLHSNMAYLAATDQPTNDRKTVF